MEHCKSVAMVPIKLLLEDLYLKDTGNEKFYWLIWKNIKKYIQDSFADFLYLL